MSVPKEVTVEADNTVSGKWTEIRQVTAPKLGACSVIAVYNKHGFVVSNISAGENKEGLAASKLCREYTRLKTSLFGSEAAMLWILYEQENTAAGSTIKPAMMGIQPVQTFLQVYDGESFMAKTNDAGARFSLVCSAGIVRAALRRQDGRGVPVALSGTGMLVRCP
jgi:hypothetical protein